MQSRSRDHHKLINSVNLSVQELYLVRFSIKNEIHQDHDPTAFDQLQTCAHRNLDQAYLLHIIRRVYSPIIVIVSRINVNIRAKLTIFV